MSLSVESCDEKTAERYWNCYVAEKCIVSKLSKISILNFNTKKLITWMKIVSFHIAIVYTILSEK